MLNVWLLRYDVKVEAMLIRGDIKMKIVKENNKVIIFIFALTIIFFLLIIQINIFKNERLTINSEELRFILEFDKNKTKADCIMKLSTFGK